MEQRLALAAHAQVELRRLLAQRWALEELQCQAPLEQLIRERHQHLWHGWHGH